MRRVGYRADQLVHQDKRWADDIEQNIATAAGTVSRLDAKTKTSSSSFCPLWPSVSELIVMMMSSSAKSNLKTLFWLLDLLCLSRFSESFIQRRKICFNQHSFRAGRETSSDTVATNDELAPHLLEAAASKFKIFTCTSTSCAKKRKDLGMDSFSTFAAFYARSKGDHDDLTISVEEGPCLGSCKMAPCVAVEHADFVGTVSLEGMTDNEFSDRVFHNVITEEDADRVWLSVTEAVRVMAKEEGTEA